MTEIPSAAKPVCKLSLIGRCTSHAGVWILGLFRGYKEGRYAGSKDPLRKLPKWAGTRFHRHLDMQTEKAAQEILSALRDEGHIFWFQCPEEGLLHYY